MRQPLHDVPLFPLPGLAHFPGHVLPLHVFEPRYRSLMKDALKRDSRFAMAVLKPGWEPDYDGRPPIFDVVTIGSITKYKELPDGRFMLHLLGVSRARVHEEQSGKPYRIGRVSLIEEAPLPPTAEARRLDEVIATMKRLCGKEADFAGACSAIGLVDAATLALPVCIEKKMEIFSTPDHAARIDAFMEAAIGIFERRDALKKADRLKPDDPCQN